MDGQKITYEEAVRRGAQALDNANKVNAFDLSYLIACMFEDNKSAVLDDILEARKKLI